ncbi:MAG: hypothetical protein FVQ77_04350 [Cytophagales bacterium]|nr:hypothetical protein [Cytophagales bacterium]
MKNYLTYLFLMMPFYQITYAQVNPASTIVTFQKTFGGKNDDIGNSVQQTKDGGYIITGGTRSSETELDDVLLIKTDALGDIIWEKSFGEKGNDAGWSVQQTADGGYIIAGEMSHSRAAKTYVYLIKTNAKGDVLWEKSFGGKDYDAGYSVQQTDDNGYIITGETSSFGAGVDDVYIIKTSVKDDDHLTKTYGGKDSDVGYSVQQTADGGFIITGLTSSFGAGGFDVYLVKTDARGEALWTKSIGGKQSDAGRSVQQTTDGGYIITGFTEKGNFDVYLIKTNAAGDTMWTKTFGGTGSDVGYSVQQTTDGGYIITGETSSFGDEDFDVYLIKTNFNGTTLWTKTFGGKGIDVGRSVWQTADEGFIITGWTESRGAGGVDVLLIKTDAKGNCKEPSNK